MRKALAHAVKIHNATAESKELPKITRRIHFHAVRYFAQSRDSLEGNAYPYYVPSARMEPGKQTK